MHEMSIALSIIDLAQKELERAGAGKVVEVELDIGVLSGIETEALRFALEVAAADTPAEDAEIRINRIEALSECLECGHRFGGGGLFARCPSCKEANTRLCQGQELQVKSLMVES